MITQFTVCLSYKQALQDALKIECSSFPENCSGKFEMECSHEQMRTEMEVLKQQVRS